MQPDAVSGRPLRPLPPIGTDPTAISESMDELNWLSHKGLINNRPLPPLGRSYEEMVGSHDSLLSGSSQLLPQCGSANSLPVPDSRYRRGILPKLSGASNLSLDGYPAAAGGRKKKKERKRKAAGKKPLPEQLREVYPPPFPSPEYWSGEVAALTLTCCFCDYWQKVTAVLVFQVTVWQQMTLLSTLYAQKKSGCISGFYCIRQWIMDLLCITFTCSLWGRLIVTWHKKNILKFQNPYKFPVSDSECGLIIMSPVYHHSFQSRLNEAQSTMMRYMHRW